MAIFFKGRVFAVCWTAPEVFKKKLGERFSLWPDTSGRVVGFIGKDAFVKGARSLAQSKTLLVFDAPAALLSFKGLRFLDMERPQPKDVLALPQGELPLFWPMRLSARRKPLGNAPLNIIEVVLETNKTDEFVGPYLNYLYSVPGKDSYERRALRVGFLRVVFGEWTHEKLKELWASLSKAQKISKFKNASSKLSDFIQSDRGKAYLEGMQAIMQGADIDETAKAAGFAAYDYRYFLSIKKKGETL